MNAATSEFVLLLVGLKTPDGPMVFPTDPQGSEFPGLLMRVKPLLPLTEQMVDCVISFLGDPGARTRVRLYKEKIATVNLSGGAEAAFYAGAVDAPVGMALNWPTLPDILRTLPKDKTRVPYMKALQLFAGGLSEEIKVISSLPPNLLS